MTKNESQPAKVLDLNPKLASKQRGDLYFDVPTFNPPTEAKRASQEAAKYSLFGMRVTRLGRNVLIASGAVAAVTVGAGVVAAEHVIERAIDNHTKTDVEKVRDELNAVKEHPEDAVEGKYVWVTVGESNPIEAARKFAGNDEGDFDALKTEFQANEVNGVMPQRDLVEAAHVDMSNEQLQNAISPLVTSPTQPAQ